MPVAPVASARISRARGQTARSPHTSIGLGLGLIRADQPAPNTEREDLYNQFRRGDIRQLILSKVGNFAIDLPDANVLIQVSGTFGSRQEEAQRLGRILRPKAGGETAHFYTLVTRNTSEMDFAHHRQLFLTEQGYSYSIADEADVLGEPAA